MPELVYTLHDISMTIAACALGNRFIGRADMNVIRKMPGGKRKGVVKTVHGLHPVLAYKIVGRVAVITDRDMLMA